MTKDQLKKFIVELAEENKALKITVDENNLLAKDYVELKEENRKLEIDKIHWRDLYWEECEKNKKLKEELEKSKECGVFRQEENNTLKNNAMEDMKVQTELEEKIRFLEQCLDNKEKVNKSMREELEKLKEKLSQYEN